MINKIKTLLIKLWKYLYPEEKEKTFWKEIKQIFKRFLVVLGLLLVLYIIIFLFLFIFASIL